MEERNMFYGAHPLIFKKADELRNNMTYAEEVLWNYLKTNKWNLKFRRQHPLSIYIVDFYCHKLKLVIEIDRSIHNLEEVKKHDIEKENNLRDLGIQIIRFSNNEIKNNFESALNKIHSFILNNHNFPSGVGDTISVISPATVANVVCGFDVLGFAINNPNDELTLSISDTAGVEIINEDNFNLPTKAEDNVCGAALLALLEETPEIKGFKLISKKHIKPGSGIGSSAASAAGAVFAANQLLNNRFSNEDLVRFAMNGEKVASGVKHADNIAPAIYGGVTLIRSIHPLDIIKINAPELHVTVVHPQIEVRTSDARQILKQSVLLKDAIKQWGNIAGLVAGFIQHDYDLIGRSLEDVIIEPVRSILIPGFNEVKTKCKEAGALGGGISGSGPSIFMLSRNAASASIVEGVMKDVYHKIGVDFQTHITTINQHGCKVVSN